MGTKLPVYGYIDPNATGVRAIEDFGAIATREQQRIALQNMMNYLARPDVQSLARSMIVDDDFDVSRDEWCRGVIREDGGARRTNLIQLLETIRGQGTIVVPTIDDLIEHKTRGAGYALERILADNVTVVEIYNLESPLSYFTEENRHADPRVFPAMADNVLKVRTALDASFANRKHWRIPRPDKGRFGRG
jgi:hypothetical protein